MSPDRVLDLLNVDYDWAEVDDSFFTPKRRMPKDLPEGFVGVD